MRSLLILLLLNGCGIAFEDFGTRPPDFVSACGAKVYGDATGYQDAENRARQLSPCELFQDWKIMVRPRGYWPAGTIGGQSGCDIAPGQRGWAEVLGDWRETSYYHEVMHHVQCPMQDVGHVTWTPRMADAIQAARTSP